MSERIGCSAMEEHLEDLALDAVDEPLRSELLDHAASCARCRGSLSEVSRVVDEVLLAAPELEPPLGFEQAVLSARDAPGDVQRRPWYRRRRTVAVIAAAAAMAIVVSLGVGSALRSDGGSVARGGVLVDPTDEPMGVAQVSSEPQPHALVALDDGASQAVTRWGGTSWGADSSRCQIQLPDGTWVTAGTWNYQEMEATGGVWAAAIPSEATAAVAMRIIGEDGTVLARAELG